MVADTLGDGPLVAGFLPAGAFGAMGSAVVGEAFLEVSLLRAGWGEFRGFLSVDGGGGAGDLLLPGVMLER